MPFGVNLPQCKTCDTGTSSLWRRDGHNDYICQSCFIKTETAKKEITDEPVNGKSKIVTRKTNVRLKSTRSKLIAKGKSRRTGLFKSKLQPKSNVSNSTTAVSDFVFYKSQYFQSGDIVSVIDAEDRQTYYAQCSQFMTDVLGSKFVSFTWLLPIKKLDQRDKFDPSLFYLGPEDDIVHDMACVEFVMHAPADYYKVLKSPYPTMPISKSKHFISANLT